MNRRILLAALFAVLAGANSGAQAQDDPENEARFKLQERLKTEATALYAKVLEKDKPPTERCSLSGEWRDEPVPEDTARKHLGLKAHANLVASYTSTTPAEVMDPGKKMPQLFCTAKELAAYNTERLRELTAKLTEEDAQPDDDNAKLGHTHIDYSFPVFDEKFQRAIIVVTWAGSSWRWRATAEGRNKLVGGVGGSVHAYVWAKKGGVWQQIDIVEMAQFD